MRETELCPCRGLLCTLHPSSDVLELFNFIAHFWKAGALIASTLIILQRRIDEKRSSLCATFPAWLCSSLPPAASSATRSPQAQLSAALQLCPATEENTSTNFSCQSQHLCCCCSPPQESRTPTQPTGATCFPLSKLPIFCNASPLWSRFGPSVLAHPGSVCIVRIMSYILEGSSLQMDPKHFVNCYLIRQVKLSRESSP